jgi:uncharacterized protein YacL
MINLTLILLRFTVIYLEENLVSKSEIKVELNSIINPWNIFISAIFYIFGVLFAFIVFSEIDRLPFIFYKDLTKLVVGIILALFKGYIDDVFKLNNYIMSTAIEKAIEKGLSTINSHFESKNPLFPETTKDGIVVRLNSHFEEGGIVSNLSKDVSTLKEDVSTILKILRENLENPTPTKRREKTNR